MHNIFISYVNDDSKTAIAIARGLEAAGFRTWYYERDSQWGADYLLTTGKAIENSQAMVLILSKNSLRKPKQISPEVTRAHETGKIFLPLMVGILWDEFKAAQPGWAQAVGAAVGMTWDPSQADEVLKRMVSGLHNLGIRPVGGGSGSISGGVTGQLQPGLLTELRITREGHKLLFRIDQTRDGVPEQVGSSFEKPVLAKSEDQLREVLDQALTSGQGFSLEQLGSLLFSTLFPGEVQIFLRNYAGPLVLCTDVPEIPWELAYDRDSRQFLGLKFAVGRQLEGIPLKNSIDAACSEEKTSVLLINSPRGVFGNSAEQSQLRVEIDQVSALASRIGIQVQVLSGKDVNFASVSMGFQEECNLGIHYTGQAVRDRSTRKYALLLPDKQLLYADTIVDVLRGSPFIFLNAYEPAVQRASAVRATESWRTVEGVAAAFLQGGALGVVCPRWRVDELVGREFSARFYEAAFTGAAFGEAMIQARHHVRKQFPKDVNWAAFVYYGDPQSHLIPVKLQGSVPPSGDSGSRSDPSGSRSDSSGAGPVLSGQAAGAGTPRITGRSEGTLDKGANLPEPVIRMATPPEGVETGLFLGDGSLNLAHFEEKLRSAINQLPAEAQTVGNNIMGAPHLLSVLLGIPDGRTQGYFSTLGVDPKALRDLLRSLIRSGPVGVSVPPLTQERFSARGLICLSRSEQIAADHGSWLVEENQLLEAILELEDGITAEILKHLDDSAQMRQQIRTLMRDGYIEPEQPLNLTEPAHQILKLAQQEAYTSGYDRVETPHFVIALTHFKEGKAARAFEMQGIAADDLRETMRELMPAAGSLFKGPDKISRSVFSTRMQELLSVAEAEALSGDRVIDEIHLITGLAHLQGSLTAEMLRLLGVDFDRLVEDARSMPAGIGTLPAKTGSGGARSAPERSAGSQTAPDNAEHDQLRAEHDQPRASALRAEHDQLPIEKDERSASYGTSYSPAVVEILTAAQVEAAAKGYPRVETPFLLIAAALAPDGCLARGLKDMGLDPAWLVRQTRSGMRQAGPALTASPLRITGYAPGTGQQERLSPRVQNVLKIAEDEAHARGQANVEDCHVVMGMLKSQGGQTIQFLKSLGLNLEALLRFATEQADAWPGSPIAQ